MSYNYAFPMSFSDDGNIPEKARPFKYSAFASSLVVAT
jgi:hypothetical protein